jgi:hypothetical protein
VTKLNVIGLNVKHKPKCGFNLNTFFDIFLLYGIEFDAQRAIVGFVKENFKKLAIILYGF